jgi:hypothetical protein
VRSVSQWSLRMPASRPVGAVTCSSVIDISFKN